MTLPGEKITVNNFQVDPVTLILGYATVHNPKHFMVFGMQLMRKKMVKGAQECMKMQASNSEIYGKMQAVFIEMDSSANVRNIYTCN